jgi:predicted CxxxxCH...CXXCH cytochrome family protein
MSRLNSFVCMAAGSALLLVGCQEYGSRSVEQGGGEEVATSRAAAGEACSASGAHEKHGQFACTTCHACGGGLSFDPSGAAVAEGQPFPTFDVTAKTCTSVACHGVPAGTYTYVRWADEENFDEYTVTYGGGSNSTTPSWLAQDAGCAACHGNPPPAYPGWHGSHAYWLVATGNDCQTCHPQVTTQAVAGSPTRQYIGTGFAVPSNCGPLRNQPCPATHLNGFVDIAPKRTSACICH